MSTVLLSVVAEAVVNGRSLIPASGSVTLDSGAIPYGRATVQLPLLDDATLNWLDPRNKVRVLVKAGDGSSIQREFDMGLRSRSVDHVSKSVTLELATDEALLQDYATLTTTTGAREREYSLRSVCNYVLARIGAKLVPGTDDADVTAQWSLTNELPNPSGELDEAHWTAAINCTIFSQVGGAYSGDKAIGILSSGAGDIAFYAMPYLDSRQSVRPGQQKTFRTAFRSNNAGRSVRVSLRWYDSQGNWYTSDVHSPTYPVTDTGWESDLKVTGTAPAGAESVVPYVTIYGGTAANQGYYVDQAGLYDGDYDGYFSGNNPDTAAYTYEWSKTADQSMSLRTAVVERPPELFTWKPGVTAWEFLLPLTSAAGMVLWCDEQRLWHLAFPESRTLPTLISVAAGVARDGSDVLSRDDNESYVTGVVVHYTWTDKDDIPREKFDAAGTPEKVLVVNMDRPYPGPGTAAATLARRQGTGRRQEVTAITHWNATPGMSANVSLPGAPDTLGRITAVTFGLSEPFMALTTAGLVDVTTGSVNDLDGTIDSLADTIDSL